jgi:hypothetical protein
VHTPPLTTGSRHKLVASYLAASQVNGRSCCSTLQRFNPQWILGGATCGEYRRSLRPRCRRSASMNGIALPKRPFQAAESHETTVLGDSAKPSRRRVWRRRGEAANLAVCRRRPSRFAVYPQPALAGRSSRDRLETAAWASVDVGKAVEHVRQLDRIAKVVVQPCAARAPQTEPRAKLSRRDRTGRYKPAATVSRNPAADLEPPTWRNPNFTGRDEVLLQLRAA